MPPHIITLPDLLKPTTPLPPNSIIIGHLSSLSPASPHTSLSFKLLLLPGQTSRAASSSSSRQAAQPYPTKDLPVRITFRTTLTFPSPTHPNNQNHIHSRLRHTILKHRLLKLKIGPPGGEVISSVVNKDGNAREVEVRLGGGGVGFVMRGDGGEGGVEEEIDFMEEPIPSWFNTQSTPSKTPAPSKTITKTKPAPAPAPKTSNNANANANQPSTNHSSNHNSNSNSNHNSNSNSKINGKGKPKPIPSSSESFTPSNGHISDSSIDSTTTSGGSTPDDRARDERRRRRKARATATATTDIPREQVKLVRQKEIETTLTTTASVQRRGAMEVEVEIPTSSAQSLEHSRVREREREREKAQQRARGKEKDKDKDKNRVDNPILGTGAAGRVGADERGKKRPRQEGPSFPPPEREIERHGKAGEGKGDADGGSKRRRVEGRSGSGSTAIRVESNTGSAAGSSVAAVPQAGSAVPLPVTTTSTATSTINNKNNHNALPSTSITTSTITPSPAAAALALATRLKKQKRVEARLAALARKGMSAEGVARAQERGTGAGGSGAGGSGLDGVVDEHYKQGLERSYKGLEVPYNYGAMIKTLYYRPLSRWVNANISEIPDRERGDVIACVKGVEYHPPGGKSPDHLYRLFLQDPSIDLRDDYFILSLFSKFDAGLPKDLRAGSVVLIRDFYVQKTDFGKGRAMGKAATRADWKWAALILKDSSSSSSSHEFKLGPKNHQPRYPDLGDQEKQMMQRMADWWRLCVRPVVGDGGGMGGAGGEGGGNALAGGKKRRLMSEMVPGYFCDLVVEIISKREWPGKVELYVTDYTRHEGFPLGTEYLHLPSIQENMVTEVCMWDVNANSASAHPACEPGKFVQLRNVRVSVRQGKVQGSMHDKAGVEMRDGKDTWERGIGWKPLNITDPLVMELLARKEGAANKPAPMNGHVDPEVAHVAKVIEAARNVLSNHLSTIHTIQPFSTISSIYENKTVPNRFRVKARVKKILPAKHEDWVVRWCGRCEDGFREDYCHRCDDGLKTHAEFRWHFWAFLQEEEDGAELPCLVSSTLVGNILPKPPQIAEDPTSIKITTIQSAKEIKDILWGCKANGEYPMHLVDLSVESYWAGVKSKEVGQGEGEVRLFRLFDMELRG